MGREAEGERPVWPAWVRLAQEFGDEVAPIGCRSDRAADADREAPPGLIAHIQGQDVRRKMDVKAVGGRQDLDLVTTDPAGRVIGTYRQVHLDPAGPDLPDQERQR